MSKKGKFTEIIESELQRTQLQKLGVMQMKTLKLLHAGKVNTEIAKELNRCTKSIESYTSAIYDTLGVRNRVGAAVLYERYIKAEEDS